MIKTMKHISIYILGLLITMVACQEKDYTLGQLETPTNIDLSYEIEGLDDDNPYGDGSGKVHFEVSANNAITYSFDFGDGRDVRVAPSGSITHQFTQNGINEYNVVVKAVGKGGLSSAYTSKLEVFSSFTDDEALQYLTGGTSKTWYWAADQPGHLGLGPNMLVDYDEAGHVYPAWYSAPAFEKDGTCLYDGEFVFTNDNGQMTFEHINATGQAFIQGLYAADLGLGEEGCYDWDISGVKNVAFGPASSIATIDGGYRGTNFSIMDDGFMGFYCGTGEYEIIEVTDNILRVRIVQANQNDFAWYHTFTSKKPGDSEEVDVEYSDLVWSDEFDTDGAPSTSNWTYDLGTGDNGWGNGEAQYYTDRTDNVKVEGGLLKITAKKETYQGKDYTSARLKSEGLYDFTYGRIDIRAKLPSGGGTWPALWMLGADYQSNTWPACGEIDIMEAIGNNPGHIQGAIHTTSSSGATVNMGSTTIGDATSEFHIYSVNWSPNQISFLVDDEIFYTYKPNTQDSSTWPFDASQFIILNVAMGGSLGGDIDPAFVESTMEIDYIKVFQ